MHYGRDLLMQCAFWRFCCSYSQHFKSRTDVYKSFGCTRLL